jgi:hypothetical protein
MKSMTAFTELPPGFCFLAAILVYDLILLLRGELTFIRVTPFYQPEMLEGLLEVVEECHETLSQPGVNSGENGFEMAGFESNGEIDWDLLLNFDFPDLS